jgi:hypothetical protein
MKLGRAQPRTYVTVADPDETHRRRRRSRHMTIYGVTREQVLAHLALLSAPDQHATEEAPHAEQQPAEQ